MNTMLSLLWFSKLNNFEPDQRILRHSFICGCGHSGTTLIANILSSHPEIYLPLRETEMFQHDKKYQQKQYNRLVRAALFARKTHLAEKTPRHIKHLDMIRADLPDARFIIPVRDGRDVVASLYKRYANLDRAINRWVNAMEIIHDNRSREDVLIYRHEDLVRNPSQELQRICSHIGVPFFKGLLEYHKKPANGMDFAALRRSQNVLKNSTTNDVIGRSINLFLIAPDHGKSTFLLISLLKLLMGEALNT